MRILALVSSHRKNGNTARVVELVTQQLQQLGAQHALGSSRDRPLPGLSPLFRPR